MSIFRYFPITALIFCLLSLSAPSSFGKGTVLDATLLAHTLNKVPALNFDTASSYYYPDKSRLNPELQIDASLPAYDRFPDQEANIQSVSGVFDSVRVYISDHDITFSPLKSSGRSNTGELWLTLKKWGIQQITFDGSQLLVQYPKHSIRRDLTIHLPQDTESGVENHAFQEGRPMSIYTRWLSQATMNTIARLTECTIGTDHGDETRICQSPNSVPVIISSDSPSRFYTNTPVKPAENNLYSLGQWLALTDDDGGTMIPLSVDPDKNITFRQCAGGGKQGKKDSSQSQGGAQGTSAQPSRNRSSSSCLNCFRSTGSGDEDEDEDEDRRRRSEEKEETGHYYTMISEGSENSRYKGTYKIVIHTNDQVTKTETQTDAMGNTVTTIVTEDPDISITPVSDKPKVPAIPLTRPPSMHLMHSCSGLRPISSPGGDDGYIIPRQWDDLHDPQSSTGYEPEAYEEPVSLLPQSFTGHEPEVYEEPVSSLPLSLRYERSISISTSTPKQVSTDQTTAKQLGTKAKGNVSGLKEKYETIDRQSKLGSINKAGASKPK